MTPELIVEFLAELGKGALFTLLILVVLFIIVTGRSNKE